MKAILDKITRRESLTRGEARAACELIMSGAATTAQIAGFLCALRTKGETVDEVTGMAECMRARMVKIDLACDDAVDCCGTGGDGSNSFNISTAAGIVAAGAGAKVAKHGNRSVSSQCGSADLLGALGIRYDGDAAQVQDDFTRLGLCFMFAPRFHPAVANGMTARRELGVRTVFNILGPTANPAGVTHQVVGVYDHGILRVMAETLRNLGCKRALVVRSRDGLDEISPAAVTDAIEIHGGMLSERTIDPTEFGVLPRPQMNTGGSAEDNARLLREVLGGDKSPVRDAVALNAGATLYVAGVASTLQDGFTRAQACITDGAALEVLKRWQDSHAQRK